MKKWDLRILLDCEGAVWNMLPGHNTPEILLEVRPESGNLIYHKANLQSGETRQFSFPDISWWSRVVYFTDELLLVQEFDEDRNPDEVKLHMYQWDGKLLWSKENARLLEVTDGGLLLSGSEFPIDPESGKKAHAPEHPISQLSLALPWHYTEEDQYFSVVSEFITSLTSETPVRAIDYFETEESAVFTYYQKDAEGLRLRLIGISEEGNVMLDEILANDLQGIADPTFLVSEMNIIFVKERRHFFVYAISDS